jgi:hypothetical protein
MRVTKSCTSEQHTHFFTTASYYTPGRKRRYTETGGIVMLQT